MSADPGPDRAERFFLAFSNLIWRAASRPARVLLPALALTLLGGWLAARLHIDTDLANLLPPEHPSVLAIERLRQTVGSETTAAVLVECPETAPMLAYAEELIPRLRAMVQPNGEPYVRSVEFRRDVAFLEQSALYLATPAELDTVEEYLEDQIEKAKVEANPMLIDLFEDETGEASAESEQELKKVRRDLIPSEYPVSEDGRTMVLKLMLTGSKTNLGFVDGFYADLGRVIEEIDPKRFHPGMSVELGGRLLRHSMELHAIGKDVFSSVGSGIALVLLVVTAYFFSRAYRVRAGTAPRLRIVLSELVRTPVAALVIGLPLGMSLAWTFGVAYLRFGALNLMTSTLALVLFGIGIDFGIHVYARYTEERGLGHPVDEAMERTLHSQVQPIVITTATTAASFGILTIAEFRGFSEFGFISAFGIMAALGAMLVVLPALIVFLERTGLLHLEGIGAGPAAKPGEGRVRFARVTVAACLAAVAAAVVLAPRIGFEWNFDRLEPDFPAYDRLADMYYRVYPPSGRNPAYVVADSPEEVPAIVAAVRARAAVDLESPTVDRVESLQERFPMEPGLQREKLERIAAIRRRLDNRWLRRVDSDDLDTLRRAAELREPLALEDLPETLRLSFTARDGQVGNFVMIYPAVGLSDGKQSIAFADDVGTVTTAGGRVYHAASTSIIAAEMLRLMRAEAPIMIALTIAGLVTLVPLAFRRLGLSALALMPVAVGFGWMLAATVARGMSLNFYNMVVLPTVLGMGEDAGVHLVHRWVEEGPGSVRRVVNSTGEAVAVCSVTTILGFSGMATSFHPGLRSMGWLAVIGLGCTLIASTVFLPALLQVIEDLRRPPGREA